MNAIARAVLVLLVALAPQAAFACPVCGASKAENDWAFGLTTLLLSVTPPLILGAMVFFIVRAVKRAKKQEETASISTPD